MVTADTLRVLLNGAAPDPIYLTPTSYSLKTVDRDDSYTLTVEQIDAAGNKSAPLTMPIIVTPVIPCNGSTTTTQMLYLQWRDFSAGAALQYRIHIWPYNDPTKEVVNTVPGNMPQAGPYKLIRGQTYARYIEWSLDGTTYAPGNRSPSTAGTYYQFTVIQ